MGGCMSWPGYDKAPGPHFPPPRPAKTHLCVFNVYTQGSTGGANVNRASLFSTSACKRGTSLHKTMHMFVSLLFGLQARHGLASDVPCTCFDFEMWRPVKDTTCPSKTRDTTSNGQKTLPSEGELCPKRIT